MRATPPISRLYTSFGILLAWCPSALALNPSLDINQYAHTAWTIRDGLFTGAIHGIAQTPDGYLWLGTEFGLLRFDGVRTVPFKPSAGEVLPSDDISRLLAARDGTLWVGTFGGLASWKNGKLRRYAELDGKAVSALFEDHEGTVWVAANAGPGGRLCAIEGADVQCHGQDGSLGEWVLALYEDTAGSLWVGAATGLWRWRPGPPKLFPMPPEQLNALNKSGDGSLLIGLNGGLRKLVNGAAVPYSILAGVPAPVPSKLLWDRSGSLWIGTMDRGLIHLHQGKTDRFSRSDGLSGDSISSLFEDREGSIWVATFDGLDRFRDVAIPTISAKQGLSSPFIVSVVAAREGSVWLSVLSDGVNRWNHGHITVYRKDDGLPDNHTQSLFEDHDGRIWVFARSGAAYFQNGRWVHVEGMPAGQTHAIAQDRAGDLLLDEDQNLLRLAGGKVVEQIPWSALGRPDYVWSLLPDERKSGIWLGLGHGLALLRQGQLARLYTSADGLGTGKVADLRFDRDGTLWAATGGGLSRLEDGRVTTLGKTNGLPCNVVHWAVEDDDHSVWLAMACGLVRIARSELDTWAANPKRIVQTTVFDVSDGVTSTAYPFSGYSPRVAKAIDGKLWFLTPGGVGIIDPRNLSINKLPPPVHVEQITADRKLYWQNSLGDATSSLRLPALVRDLQIDYTALSMAAPEKIRFKYKLEGRDRDWQDVGNRRQAFYSDLAPRSYRFRVAASNNHGVWNEAGASFDFSVARAYYQTSWFQASCAIAFLALLWGLYQYRLHQVAREYNVRLEERVAERTRLARDLHDTLLQSFQGLMLRFQVVEEMLPPGRVKEEMEKTLERADLAIAEGRTAVYDLRSSTTTTNDLAEALRALGNELATPDAAAFRLVVEGSTRDLHPIIRDEIYRITREAVRNAFAHAQARHIEAEITYADRLFRLRIRDDGQGIAPAYLEEGRPGHYGLPGMRERAQQIGAALSIWSGAGAGTEIELSISGSIAYGTTAGRSRLRLFRRKAG